MLFNRISYPYSLCYETSAACTCYVHSAADNKVFPTGYYDAHINDI